MLMNTSCISYRFKGGGGCIVMFNNRSGARAHCLESQVPDRAISWRDEENSMNLLAPKVEGHRL